MTYTLPQVVAVYRGSDGAMTKALYERLEALGPHGVVAMNLLRTCKASECAKVYRGGQRGRGSYRAMAYDKKDWSIGELCRALRAADVDSWGWGIDLKAVGFEHVLYVDLPGGFGQVSFHTSLRRDGHDYAGAWDGAKGTGPDRICRFAAAALAADAAEQFGQADSVQPPEGDDHGPRQHRTEGTPAAAAPAGTDEQTRQKAFDL